MFSCLGQEKSNNFGKKSKIKLEESFDIKLSNRLFLSWDGSKMFGWDNNNNTIKKFDFHKKSFYDEYKSEIKNSENHEEIVCAGHDSLLTFAWNDKYTANLINGKGKILKKYNLNPSKHINIFECGGDRVSYCYLQGTIANTRHNNSFYYAAQSMGESKISGKLFSAGKLNLKDGTTEFLTEYPSIYHKYNWGAMYYYFPSLTINDNKQLIISYPVSHKLYVYDLITEKKESVNGGSSLFLKISPFSNKKEEKPELKSEYTKYYQLNYAYGGIAYDKKRKLYYRLVLHPNKNYGETADPTRKKSIIVLDENFNFLGEAFLPFNKNYYRIIATDYGIVVSYFNFKTKGYGFTVFNIT